MSYGSKLAELGAHLILYAPLAADIIDIAPTPRTLTASGTVTPAQTGSPNSAFAEHTDFASAASLGCAAASGSALDLHDVLSVGVLVKLTALPASGTPSLLGRSTSYYLMTVVGPGGTARVTVNGSTAPPAGDPTTADTKALVAGEWMLLGYTWSVETGEVRTWLNGALSAVVYRNGAIAAGTQNFALGSSGLTTGFAANGLFVADVELGAAEWQDLAAVAGVMPAWTDLSNLDGPTATAAGAGIDNTRLTQGEARIIDSRGRAWRPESYGAHAMDTAALYPNSGNAQTLVPKLVRKLRNELIVRWTQRASSTDLAWYDGEQFRFGAAYATMQRTSIAPFMEALADIHVVESAGQKRSRAMSAAIRLGERLLEAQDPSTGELWVPLPWVPLKTYLPGERFNHAGLSGEGPLWHSAVAPITAGAVWDSTEQARYTETGRSPNTEWTMPPFVRAYLLLRDDLPASVAERWLAAIDLAGTYLTQTGLGFEGDFYTNGNIELLSAWALYAIYAATGDGAWKTAFDTQWAQTLNPTAYRSNETTVPTYANAVGYGLHYAIELTIPAATAVTLTYKGQTTATLAANPTAAQVFAALDTLSTIPDQHGTTALFITPGANATKFIVRLPGLTGSYVAGDLTGSGGTTVTVHEPTLPDGSDGKGYLAEKGSNAASTGTNGGKRGAAGLDWSYLGECLEMAMGLHSDAIKNGDSATADDALWLLNLMTNMVLDRANLSAWNYDYSNGARKDNVTPEPLLTSALAHLVWGGYRSAASLGNPAFEGQWAKLRSDVRANAWSANENYSRMAGALCYGWIHAGP